MQSGSGGGKAFCESEIEQRKGQMRRKMQEMCTNFLWRLTASCAKKDVSRHCHSFMSSCVACNFSFGRATDLCSKTNVFLD